MNPTSDKVTIPSLLFGKEPEPAPTSLGSRSMRRPSVLRTSAAAGRSTAASPCRKVEESTHVCGRPGEKHHSLRDCR